MAEGELSFADGAALLEALATPDAVARRSVLGWVATHPREAIELVSDAGADLLDVLIGLINRDWDYAYWEDVAIAIGAFDSPRVTDFFAELLASAEQSEQADDAAAALARRRGAPGLNERLVEILFSDGPPERLTATAELLAAEPELPPAASIRVSLVDEERDAPPIGEATADAWLAELAGPFAEGARERLELQGPDAIRALTGRWDGLGSDDRAWLLDWASEALPDDPETAALVVRGLDPADEALALEALRAATRLPAGALAAESLAPWAEHERPELRAAAVAAGAPLDVDAALASPDTDPDIAIEAIRRAATPGGAEAAAAIAPQLERDSLEVRNAARSELVALGAPAIVHLRPLVHSDSPETRAAAVRALLDLGDDDWLAAELLD